MNSTNLQSSINTFEQVQVTGNPNAVELPGLVALSPILCRVSKPSAKTSHLHSTLLTNKGDNVEQFLRYQTDFTPAPINAPLAKETKGMQQYENIFTLDRTIRGIHEHFKAACNVFGRNKIRSSNTITFHEQNNSSGTSISITPSSTAPTLAQPFMGSFMLDASIVDVECQLELATQGYQVDVNKTYLARSGHVAQIIWGEEDHEDEEDMLMVEHGNEPMDSRQMFIFRVRDAIIRLMRNANGLQVLDLCVEEFIEHHTTFRNIVYLNSDQYIPAKGIDYKRGVQEIFYRSMESHKFEEIFGEILPIKRRSDWVFLRHNSVRFYYRKNFKVGIVVNLFITSDPLGVFERARAVMSQ
jgi:hypothetical protein